MRRRRTRALKTIDSQCGGFPISLLVWATLCTLWVLMPLDVFRIGFEGLVSGLYPDHRPEYSRFSDFILLLSLYTGLDVARGIQVHRCRLCAVIGIGAASALVLFGLGLTASLVHLREHARARRDTLWPVRSEISDLLLDDCLKVCPRAPVTLTIVPGRDDTVTLYRDIPYADSSGDSVSSRVVIAPQYDLPFSTLRRLVDNSRAAGAEAVCVVDPMDAWFDVRLAALPPIVDRPEELTAPVCNSRDWGDVDEQVVIDGRGDRLAIHAWPDASWGRISFALCTAPLVTPGYPYLDVEIVAVPRAKRPPVRERRGFGLITPVKNSCD